LMPAPAHWIHWDRPSPATPATLSQSMCSYVIPPVAIFHSACLPPVPWS
jgi:hypothetical protein